jgi:hypothetical protein
MHRVARREVLRRMPEGNKLRPIRNRGRIRIVWSLPSTQRCRRPNLRPDSLLAVRHALVAGNQHGRMHRAARRRSVRAEDPGGQRMRTAGLRRILPHYGFCFLSEEPDLQKPGSSRHVRTGLRRGHLHCGSQARHGLRRLLIRRARGCVGPSILCWPLTPSAHDRNCTPSTRQEWTSPVDTPLFTA